MSSRPAFKTSLLSVDPANVTPDKVAEQEQVFSAWASPVAASSPRLRPHGDSKTRCPLPASASQHPRTSLPLHLRLRAGRPLRYPDRVQYRSPVFRSVRARGKIQGMKPRGPLVLAAVIIVGSAVQAHAEPLGPTTVNDRDDVDKQLDIRSVTVDTLRPERTRVELVFWNPVPPRALSRRAARVEFDGYFVRFWPGRHQLRVTWGDAASSCCVIHRARHPNPFSYRTVISLDQAQPPATEVRGCTTRRLDCTEGSRCGSSGGTLVDRTRWADL